MSYTADRKRTSSVEELVAGKRAIERRRTMKALLLVAPLFIFTLLLFVVPLVSVMFYAVDDREVKRVLPRTLATLTNWDGESLPAEEAYDAILEDIRVAATDKTISKASVRLNYEVSGFRSLLMLTANQVDSLVGKSVKTAMINLDSRWGELQYWRGIRMAGGPLTPRYLLAALDLKWVWNGRIDRAPKDQRIYISYLIRTFWISFMVLVLCILIGFPIAYVIANSSPFTGRILFYCVLLPFWTSLLVRTAAWVILLQREGILNNILVWIGFINQPIQLIFNRFGVYIAMVHLLVPFMILPLYSVMKGIPKVHMRAAASLGARPLSAFLTIYLPQTLPGLGAGCLLVFILALGFYITPALVGGAGDQMLAYLVAQFALGTANWGMAAALGIILLLCVAILYPMYRRYVGAERIRLG